jgi:hypothetical protein
MSAAVLKELAATHNVALGVLGHLTWYSISETQIKRDELLYNLRRCGLDEGWMPPEIRVPDAFRKATKAIERKKVAAGENIHNYLVREISSDKKHVQRNIVLEVVDVKGRRLHYEPEEAILVLDKKTGTIITHIKNPGSLAAELANQASDLFNTFKDHHDARTIRSMVQNILRSMAPTPVRPSGGVYFVPVNYKQELEKLTAFLSNLPGESEAFMIPLINNPENRDMVRKKLNDHLKDTLRFLRDGLFNPKLDKSNASMLLGEAKRRLQDFEEYKKVLADEMSDMQELIGLIQAQMLSIIEKV